MAFAGATGRATQSTFERESIAILRWLEHPITADAALDLGQLLATKSGEHEAQCPRGAPQNGFSRSLEVFVRF
jgi:hypothetical protein